MKKGDIIKFGKYPPKDNDSFRPPIEWLVLDVKGNEALLISRYALDCKEYHHEFEHITWEDCDLRKWLNSDFLKSVFSNEESERILVSELRNDDNPKYGTRGGNDTKDRIFCLSIAEAEQYFSSDEDIQCRPTAYAREQGALVDSENDCCNWWLRSPGFRQYLATCGCTDGVLALRGYYVNIVRAVRPALRIICNETLEQRKQREERRQREEQERKQQREEQERRQRELLAQAHEEFSAIIKKGIRKGMIIPFGAYPQDNNSFRTPIEWLVLDVNLDAKKTNFLNRVFAKNKLEVLLISRYGLDCKQYHHEFENITWEDCDLRKWLNSDFLKSAFSNEESERILVSELRNDNNPEYGTPGGNDTKDRIFCLSIAEAEQYFSSDKDRQCRPTAYVRAQGARGYNDCCYWWLRSPGISLNDAACVRTDGAFNLGGSYVSFGNDAVRPALRIIFDETLEQRNRREEEERRQREEQERRQREEQERRQKELLAQAHEEFSAIIKKGMIIPFGAYPQDNDCFRPPIEWLVLDVKGNEALLISRYGLDCKRYHPGWENTTWEDCDLRKWLNSDFLKSAFSNEESERILVSELRNDYNPEYGTPEGNDTKDRIFCLSIAEAEQYFSSDEDRQCRPTAYAREQGALVDSENDCCWWWLRSPGRNQDRATHVDSDGALDLHGSNVDDACNAVRPALRIICNL